MSTNATLTMLDLLAERALLNASLKRAELRGDHVACRWILASLQVVVRAIRDMQEEPV